MSPLLPVCLAALACTPGNGELGTPSSPGPGSEEWGTTSLACESHDDCGVGEACYEEVCQPKRCELVERPSRPPLGAAHEIVSDLELAVADGGHIAFYSPRASLSQMDADGSVAAGSLVDLVAGRPGEDGEPAVGAVSGLRINWHYADGGTDELYLPETPAHAAAGDLDGDGVDEVAIATASGAVYRCGSDGCAHLTSLGAAPDGIAVAFAAGPVVLVAAGEQLHAISADGGRTTISMPEALALAAGDLDGDGHDEILAVHGNWWPFGGDRIAVYQLAGTDLIESAFAEVPAVRDLAVGDLDGDLEPEVVVLTDEGAARIYHSPGVSLEAQTEVPLEAPGEHLALYDRDRDSARVDLVGEPTLVTGNPFPMIAVTFPPYHRDFSRGEPSVALGVFDSEEEYAGAGTSMDLGVEVGVSVGAEGLLTGGFTAAISRRISRHSGRGLSLTVGQYLSVDARPELYGDAYGAVLLGHGCYEQYVYRLVDPAGRAPHGVDGGELVILVPVGGKTSLWSTPRYNQLAEFRGDLPIVEVATRLGNISSYPGSPHTLDGQPVAADDYVFDRSVTFGVSDVAEIGWSMSVGESVRNTESSKISLSGKASVKVVGVKLAATTGIRETATRSLTLSSSSMLRGRTPPIPDDPDTPEDEYASHAFSFTPVVYKHRYQTSTGETAAFFALTYAVGEAD